MNEPSFVEHRLNDIVYLARHATPSVDGTWKGLVDLLGDLAQNALDDVRGKRSPQASETPHD